MPFDAEWEPCVSDTRGFLYVGRETMDKRIALIGIIVEDTSSTAELNEILHEYGGDIVARMGVPYRERSVCIISVAVDAPADRISSLAGKLGRLRGVSVKTMYTKMDNETGRGQHV